MSTTVRSDGDAPPERHLAVYDGDELLLVLRRGGGEIEAPEEGAPGLARHPALSGRFVVFARVDELLAILRENADEVGVVRALGALGLEVVETPASALDWV